MPSNKQIGIVGSGLIGRNWAMIFASAGFYITLYDNNSNQLKDAKTLIQIQMMNLESKGLLRGKLSASEQLNNISYTDQLTNLAKGAFFIQECIPERVDFKKSLLAELDKLINDETIIASSTSTILPSVLSSELMHKSQFMVAHPINPPYFVPLVEIVPAPWTKSELVDKVYKLMEKVGQTPIKLKKETAGFVLNRIQYAILNECFHLVNDGYLDAENVDKVMTEGLGMRYAFSGPLETAHLNAEGFLDYCDKYGQCINEVSQQLKPPPEMKGPTAAIIAEQLTEKIPLSKLDERRKWRDDSLIKLSQLKKNN